MLIHSSRDNDSITSASSPDGREYVTSLIHEYISDHTLQQDFYTSEPIYQMDVNDVLMNNWHCAGHVSQISTSGQYILFEYDNESMIIVRGNDNEIRAFANVCRHRGSRICSSSGKAEGGVLICPYHAWSYSLEGKLEHARMMPREFEKEEHGLKPLPIRISQGLIFVSFSDYPLGFEQVEHTLKAVFSPYGWETAKVACQTSTTFNANWKLAIENQVECYHCAPSHPEFSLVHGQSTRDELKLVQQVIDRACELGVDPFIRDQWALNAVPGQESDYADKYALRKGVVTASPEGKPVAPLMGAFSEYDGGHSIAYVGVLNHLLAYPDYGAIFRYTPRSSGTTELVVTWLVKGDAVEGVDYNVDDLTWMWRVTAAADKRIVEQNQLGVSSRYYRPGPYALPIEHKTKRLAEWYLSKLSESLR